MNKFARKALLLAVIVATVASMAATTRVKAAPVTIKWFVGLGTGTNEAQLAAEYKVVEDFNASHPDIVLEINLAGSNQTAIQTMATLIASGDAPDVVGPVGVGGSNSFAGQWLDLNALIASTKYDMSQFPDAVKGIYAEGTAQTGIPFATFPSMLYYNIDLFDEAGLAYPPKAFGEKYMLDGKEVEWNYETVATIAKILTVDANGNDATSEKFDPNQIVQYGFDHQWDTIRADWLTFGPGELWNGSKITIAENWRAQSQWMWNGIWKDHFIPNATAIASDLLKPSAFASGKVAMTRVFLWYTCCMTDDAGKALVKFDLAPVPMYNGSYYAPMDADTFRIYKDTKNPEAAFTVLQYILGDAALTLLQTYGAYPARADLAQPYIDAQTARYPSVTNWAIVNASLAYGVNPHHESFYPNFNAGQDRIGAFGAVLRGDGGDKLDLAAELDKLQADLQVIAETK